MNAGCIVVASHLRYDAIAQRPHHIIARLRQRLPVLVVEEPMRAAADANEFANVDGVDRLRPKRAVARGALDARTIDAVRAWVGDRRPLLWFYQPMMSELADAFDHAPVVFDCMDELAAFDSAPHDLPARERALCARACVVFAGGRSLYDRRASLGSKIALYPSGVDVEHFARARTLEAPPLLTALAKPVCTYVGAIDERIDFACVVALAERGASVVLVGPILKIDAAALPRHPNVHFAGAVPYADVPPLLAGTDVAIMPFARNAATAAISPTKTPEYAAAGRPIVSTRIADVERAYGDVVVFADDANGFADACLSVASDPDAGRIVRGVARAGERSWDAIVAQMWRDIEREATCA